MIFKGFRFGMVLQLAVGPVFMYIFKLASNEGFIAAEMGVLAVTIIDALYIILAIFGITSFIEKESVKSTFKILGAMLVIAFGLNIIAEILGWSLLPNFKLINNASLGNSFSEALVLTASNPLTILFWAGVFSSKIAEENLNKQDVDLFGLGAILSTASFLSLIAVLGSSLQPLIPLWVVKGLNLFVGLTLIYFGTFRLLKKN